MIPYEVVIEVTSFCNYNCNGCFNKYSFAESGRSLPQGNLDTLSIKQIIDSVVSAGIQTIRFTGGEPLLRRDLEELFIYSRKKNLKIRLNTNASLVDQTNAALINEYVEDILISFNGYDDESDEAWTRIAGSFYKKMEGLKKLNPDKLKIRGGTVLTSANIVNLEKIFTQIQSTPISNWEVYRPITLSPHEPLKDEIETVLEKLIKLSVQFKTPIKIANAIPFCLSDRETMNALCLGAIADDGHSRLIVDPKGFAKPSYFINENIGSAENILDCWNHPFMKSMRELKFLPEKCLNCEYKEKCKGGSRFKAHSVYNDYSAPDSLMPLK